MGTVGEKRNYGIDLLRILSMLMVLLLHILGHGGILSAAPRLSLNYEVAWFLETMAYCAVNCYALISGYVGVGTKHKYSNIVSLWLQVAFYTVGITAVYIIVSPNFYAEQIQPAFFPVSNQYYWYFTAYFGMFFLIPLLNHAINNMDEKQLKTITVTLVAVFSILPTWAKADVFRTVGGYDLLWLTVLYLIGGSIKKCGWFRNTPVWKAGAVYLISVGLGWGVKYLSESNLLPWFTERVPADSLISYTAPTILATGISLLVMFMNMNITAKFPVGIIKFFAPLAFSVYLIQEHPLIREQFISGRFAVFASHPWWQMILEVLGTGLGIFLIAVSIDLIRHYLFKWLKIKERLRKLEIRIRERKKEKV